MYNQTRTTLMHHQIRRENYDLLTVVRWFMRENE